MLRLQGYTEQEKLEIARQYLVKKQREQTGLSEKNIVFKDDAILEIIRYYTREAGVRNLEREIGNVCRKVARKVVKSGAKHKEELTAQNINEFLGVAKFRDSEVHEKSEIGLVTGLAWTEVGGSILTTEVQVLDGKGKLTITGQLGDVMQESAQAALSYIRGKAQALGLTREFYRNVDLHLHVPEGAIPKDGPSAGITMATALASALAKIPVRRDIAMTGEITLRGKVLAIGGLKEKLLAALRAGIFEVILPRANEKDIAELPDNIKNSMKLHFVDTMDEVLALALEGPLPTALPAVTETLAAVPARRSFRQPARPAVIALCHATGATVHLIAMGRLAADLPTDMPATVPQTLGATSERRGTPTLSRRKCVSVSHPFGKSLRRRLYQSNCFMSARQLPV